ncbi:helix-turn-helix domain-containing protein [Nocardia sp. NPDC003482]
MNIREAAALKTFGKKIAELRRARGLTQEQLAERSDLALPTIAAIERGKRWPRLMTLQKLAKALHVPTGDLFERL